MATSEQDKLDFYCQKCGKTMKGVKFYTYQSGQKCEFCKDCLTMHLDTYKEDTILWILEKMDVPWIPEEWKKVREKEFQKAYDKACQGRSKDPQTAAYNMTRGNSAVMGKYLGKMRMTQFNKFRWADTEQLKIKREELAKLNGQPDAEELKAQQEEMRERFEKGEISEAQYMTYMDYNPDVEAKKSLEDIYLENDNKPDPDMQNFNFEDAGGDYPVNAHPFEEVELDDVGADLTEEDKKYLAMKWGRLYKASDWVTLEQLYLEYDKSFDLHNADLIAGIKQVCKLDLKCNQALDSGDVDSYSKLARAADTLRKSLKLTEAQRKEDKSTEFSGYGLIVAFAEKEGGFIPRLETKTERDVADRDLHDMKAWTKDLVDQDPAIYKMIEQYIKKREIAAEQEADLQEAIDNGDEQYVLTDQDMADYNASLSPDLYYDEEMEDEEE